MHVKIKMKTVEILPAIFSFEMLVRAFSCVEQKSNFVFTIFYGLFGEDKYL